MLQIDMRHRSAQHRPAATGLHCRPLSRCTAVQFTPCMSLMDDLPSASLFLRLRVNLSGASHTSHQARPVWGQGASQRHVQRWGGGQEGLGFETK